MESCTELETNDIKGEHRLLHRLHTVMDLKTYFAVELFTPMISDQCQPSGELKAFHVLSPHKVSHQFHHLLAVTFIILPPILQGMTVVYGSGWIFYICSRSLTAVLELYSAGSWHEANLKLMCKAFFPPLLSDTPGGK